VECGFGLPRSDSEMALRVPVRRADAVGASDVRDWSGT
jgi:hypothetical protein